MRSRMVAIHVALLLLVPLTLCVTPVAETCPVCEENADDRFVQEKGIAAVDSTATVTVTSDHTAEWTVVNEVSLGPNQTLASVDAIENRTRDRIRHQHRPDSTLQSLTVETEAPNRVRLTFTITGTVYDGPGDVVIYEGFDVDDGYDATVVNAETLTVRGPGETAYATKGGVGEDGPRTVDDGTVRYERNDRLDTDTLLVFGMADGVRGSVQLRRALAVYHQERLRAAGVLFLIPALIVAVAVLTVARSTGGTVIDDSFERSRTRAGLAVLAASMVAAIGIASEMAPLSAVTTAYAAGLGLLSLGAYTGLRSRRERVPIALCGTILATALVGVALGLVGGGTADAGRSAVVGPPPSIATPGSVGIVHAVWATLVAAPMALGAAGNCSRRAHLLGTLGVAGVVYAVLLAWWWPIVAPISVGGYLASGLVATVALVVVALVSYATGYAFRTLATDGEHGAGPGGGGGLGSGGGPGDDGGPGGSDPSSSDWVGNDDDDTVGESRESGDATRSRSP